VLFVGVRGSGETNDDAYGFGETNYAVERQLSTLLRPIDVVGEPVDYPAVDIVKQVLASGYQGIDVYRVSERAGEEQLINTLYLWHHRCPNYLFALSGYSQGAQVVGNVMASLARDPSSSQVFGRITGAVLFGDPIYNPKDPVAVSPPQRPVPGLTGVMASYLAGVDGVRPIYQPPLNELVRSWCAEYDPICSSFPPTAAAQLATCFPKSPCPHMHYADWAAEPSARWLADQVRGKIASGSQPGNAQSTPAAQPSRPSGMTTSTGSPGRHDCEAFVGDLTLPDGSTVTANETFSKTWRLRNCGNTNWSDLTAVRVGGSFGPEAFAIPATAPGATIDLTIKATAPSTAGRQRATYRLLAPDGHYADNSFWIEINVVAPANVPPVATIPPPGPGQIPPVDDPGQSDLPSGAHELGGIDLERYCADGWGLHVVLRFPNTWGWRCAPTTVPADGNRVGDQYIDTNAACAQQYGPDAKSHYRDYHDPYTWYCWALN
jgi:hypothetical protein